MTSGPGHPVSPARAAAAEVLTRVFTADAFASAALDAVLHRGALDPRDAALCTELVYGVLRAEGFLDQRLEALASAQGLRPRSRASAPTS